MTSETFNKELGNIPTTLIMDKDSTQKLNKLKEDIDRLQNDVLKSRDTYQQTLNNSKTLSQLKMFQINEKFELNRDDASYTLSIEAEVPIDNVLLQCDVPIDLLDSEKNSCVLSYSDCDENVFNF
jgi:Bardet-Biedl syndrome 7 protein